MLHWGLAAGSALGSSPPRSSTSPGCHRPAPESVPTGAPGPSLVAMQSLGPARQAAPGLTIRCQPDTLPQPGPATPISMPQPSQALR